MQELLAGWDCEAIAARDIVSAVAHAELQSVDLFLLDFHLDGGETGIDLLNALRARGIDRPCVLITADHSEDARVAAAAAGCALLHKPVKPLALKSLMARLLATRDSTAIA